MHHNTLMQCDVYDRLAFCRYQHDRLARTVNLSKALREVLSRRLTLMTLQRSRNSRIYKQLVENRKQLAQLRRILQHGPTTRYII